MTRIRCAATVAMLVMTSAMAVAADSPLASISNEADVVIRLKAPKTTIGKIASLADKVQPGIGGMISQQGAMIGAAVQNPTGAGISQTKDWYIAVYTNGQEEPSVLFAVPVTDADAAKGALSDEFSSKAVEDWLFYSKDEEALPEGETSESIAAVMRGEPTTVFDKGDLSIFVNIGHLTEAYSEELEMADEQVENLVETIGSQMPPTPGMDMKAILGVYSDVVKQVLQGVKDAQQLTVAINIADDGITAEDYLSFGESTTTAEALASHPRNEMKNIAKLPDDAVIVYGASTDISKLTEWGMQMTSEMFGENEELKAGIAEFQTAAKDLKWGSIVGALSLGAPDQGVVRSVTITEVSPVAKYKDLMRSVTAKMGAIEVPGLKQSTTVQADAETFGSQKADIVTVTQEFDENLDPTGMQKQMQAMMFGPEGMKSYLVYQSDKVVQSMGGGKDAMAAVLKKVDGTASAGGANHRKGLIPNPNVLVLLDLPGLAVQGLKMASAIPGLPIQIDAGQLDSLTFEKSYIGFSAAAEKNAVRVKTRLPVEQVQALMAVGIFAQSLHQGRNN
jgi:hypothetical protein